MHYKHVARSVSLSRTYPFTSTRQNISSFSSVQSYLLSVAQPALGGSRSPDSCQHSLVSPIFLRVNGIVRTVAFKFLWPCAERDVREIRPWRCVSRVPVVAVQRHGVTVAVSASPFRRWYVACPVWSFRKECHPWRARGSLSARRLQVCRADVWSCHCWIPGGASAQLSQMPPLGFTKWR